MNKREWQTLFCGVLVAVQADACGASIAKRERQMYGEHLHNASRATDASPIRPTEIGL